MSPVFLCNSAGLNINNTKTKIYEKITKAKGTKRFVFLQGNATNKYV